MRAIGSQVGVYDSMKRMGMKLFRIYGIGLVWMNKEQVQTWVDLGHEVVLI
jgi:hypothetical protein